MCWKAKMARTATALFFAALLLVGLATCADYGLPCDEPAEQVILQENMHEYAARLLGEDSAAAQWYETRNIQRISQSVEKDHGQSAYYLFMPLVALFGDQPHRLTLLWKIYTWLLFMLGCSSVWGFCRETGMRRFPSVLGVLLLYLCPRFFAEGHYNNKDMVLLSLLLCTLWLGVRFLKKPGFVRGALLSLAGAFAANTKIVGALGWELMGLAAIVLVTARREWSRRMAGVALSTILLFFVFYALLTPACWADPLGYVQYLLVNASGFTRWTGVVLFRGMVFDHDVNPLPRYYLIWMMIVTLPLYVVPLAAAGQLSALGRAWKQKAAALRDPILCSHAAATLCWFLPLAAAVFMRPLVYNGWRHFYFVYAGVVLLAAQGIEACLRFLKRHGGDCGMHLVLAAGLVLFFGWTARGMMQSHPCQHSYYNLLGHNNAASAMELDYWELSTKNALEQLLASEERNTRLRIEVGAMEDMSWLGLKNARSAMEPEDKKRLWLTYRRDTPYIFSNTTYARIYQTKAPRGYHELITLESYGVPVCTIYERNW